jgi:hypothetical protein
MNKQNSATIQIRIVFADEGAFHAETVSVPAAGAEDYERLIDFLREDGEVTRRLHLDMRRLVSATRLDEE